MTTVPAAVSWSNETTRLSGETQPEDRLVGAAGLYLFGRVGRLGEDGLPVGPHEHDEGDVEEDQIHNWKGSRAEHKVTNGNALRESSIDPHAIPFN